MNVSTSPPPQMPQNLPELNICFQDSCESVDMQLSSVGNEIGYHFEVCIITNWAHM